MVNSKSKMINVDHKQVHEVSREDIRAILDTVMDPEIPVLSVIDLGIVRNFDLQRIESTGDLKVIVVLTPTYMGCPAMDMICMNVRLALAEHGFKNVEVSITQSPAWTTAWMTEAGKEKLREYGIAPPLDAASAGRIDKLFGAPAAIACPLCGSVNTRLVSQFGSTACKALYQCNECKEPFDYFKCH